MAKRELQKMELYKYLNSDRILLKMETVDRFQALKELLGTIFPEGSEEYMKVLPLLLETEKKRCNAIGRGVAVAHAVSDEVDELTVAFGRSDKGIPWHAPDEREVNLVWLIIHPEKGAEKYLYMLAQVMIICRRSVCRSVLSMAQVPADVIRVVRDAKPRARSRG